MRQKSVLTAWPGSIRESTPRSASRRLGAITLHHEFPEARVSAVCQLANRCELARCRDIRQTLQNGTDLDDTQAELQLPQRHANVRGPADFK